MQIKVISSLAKVFLDDAELPEEISGASALQGEVYSFQVAVKSDYDGFMRVTLASDINVRIRTVDYVPNQVASANRYDDNYLRQTPGLYPDLLKALHCGDRFHVRKNVWRTLWVTAIVGPDQTPGTYRVSVKFTKIEHGMIWQWDAVLGEAVFNLEVLPAALPEQKLKRLEWFHADCLFAYYRVDCWSEAHWQALEHQMRNARRHGVNILYTPLWTPPLDTFFGGERPNCQLLGIAINHETKEFTFDFTYLLRYLRLAKRCGFDTFAMSHFFSQWGANYTPKIVAFNGRIPNARIFLWTRADHEVYLAMLKKLLPQLLQLLREEGLAGKCYFSISDEPAPEHLESYSYAVNAVRPLLEDFPTIEALSDIRYFEKDLVRNPVPAIDHIEPFVGKVKELWTYYCVAQDYLVSNRFMAMPSARNRIFGVLAYVYDLKGFLHWGFNFYYSQFSVEKVNPFANTDCSGAFPGGDAFMVYPGENFEVWDSVRHEVFAEALQDLRSLELLEQRIGRPEVLKLIHQNLNYQLTMTQYPREASWLLDLRQTINRMV